MVYKGQMRDGGSGIPAHVENQIWQRDRSRMPYALRLAAAANDARLYQRHPSPYILSALAKYLLVRWARLRVERQRTPGRRSR